MSDELITADLMIKDQNWMEGMTIYWFRLDGTDYGTGLEFDNCVYGIIECGPETHMVNADGVALTMEAERIAVAKHCKVTEKMRAE